MREKIVIIGNGIAAISAIKAIREVDKEIEIKVFGEEKFYPYSRLKLSKGLLGSLEEDKMLLQKKQWYEENNIDINLNAKAISINTEEKEVTFLNGHKENYSKLLLANGSSNIAPPIDNDNRKSMLTLRTLEDARKMVDTAKHGNTILSIGGGILSLELAWVLCQLGKKVIISEILPRLMPKQLDERASSILKKSVEAQGVDIILNNEIKGICAAENKIEGILNGNGDFTPCDMITYSIGIKPNIDIIRETSIAANKGILVNEKMETSVKDIYAAGDIVEYENRVYGLWNIAISQGNTAGYNIVGKESIYKSITPVTTMNAFNISLFSMGNVQDSDASNVIVEDDGENNSYKKIFIKDNKINGAVIIGSIKGSQVIKKAIEERLELEGINFDNVYIDELVDIIRNKK
ncbi:NAD(P)/FAD-dependent oxidoreductase [Clostridium sp. DJ247]|uniref:NAD(P)/FAD-dependent oxidoreductase n=1 Tax=Clostridium sp. DJ247 TaxID=2726188 RepID=UPI0016240404|nr:FAD-dependent oxidoreductase [Clostridium sp. DJ247]MBC2579466.1 NAD(P)/FAD-dependent oxidoreductase [Clostridium sp. DJ247]